MRRVIRLILLGIGALVLLVATAWAAGALYFDLPMASLRKPLALTYAGGHAGHAHPGQEALAWNGACRALFRGRARRGG